MASIHGRSEICLKVSSWNSNADFLRAYSLTVFVVVVVVEGMLRSRVIAATSHTIWISIYCNVIKSQHRNIIAAHRHYIIFYAQSITSLECVLINGIMRHQQQLRASCRAKFKEATENVNVAIDSLAQTAVFICLSWIAFGAVFLCVFEFDSMIIADTDWFSWISKGRR